MGQVYISALEEISADKCASDIANKHKIQSKMNCVYNYLGLRSHDIEDTGVKNKRDYNKINTGGAGDAGTDTPTHTPTDTATTPRLNPECRQILSDFYEPFNKLLEVYLIFKVKAQMNTNTNTSTSSVVETIDSELGLGLDPLLNAIKKW